MEKVDFPECLKCKEGVLIPLSDYGRGRRSHSLQSMGLHESKLRIPYENRQRRAEYRRGTQEVV